MIKELNLIDETLSGNCPDMVVHELNPLLARRGYLYPSAFAGLPLPDSYRTGGLRPALNTATNKSPQQRTVHKYIHHGRSQQNENNDQAQQDSTRNDQIPAGDTQVSPARHSPAIGEGFQADTS